MLIKRAIAMMIVSCMLFAGMTVMMPNASAAIEADPDEYPLYAGQDELIGTVSIWNDDTCIYVHVEISAPGWVLKETHVAYGDMMSDIPQKNGNPIPGKFPMKEVYPVESPYTTEDDFCIPICSFADAESCVLIAVHAAVAKLSCEGIIIQEETAWGGDEDFFGKNWATFMTYCLTREIIWPQSGTVTLAYEDGAPDYDYNDFVVSANINALFNPEGMMSIEFSYEARARGASWNHAFQMEIPAGTFTQPGTYTITNYDNAGNVIGVTSGDFDNTAIFTGMIFANTNQALLANAANGWAGNTVDGTGTMPGQEAVLTIEFNNPVSFDLSTYTYSYVGVHADNLFFNPVLIVKSNGDAIVDQGDVRTLIVPTDWQWPQEQARINLAYPFNAVENEGVSSANPPVFSANWYEVTPTGYIWTP